MRRMTPGERYALGSIVIGCLVLGLKTVAWRLTGSVALYSDALESIVNVAASMVALVALRFASRPADANHPYGHDKAELPFVMTLEACPVSVLDGALAEMNALPFHVRRPLAVPVLGT